MIYKTTKFWNLPRPWGGLKSGGVGLLLFLAWLLLLVQLPGKPQPPAPVRSLKVTLQEPQKPAEDRQKKSAKNIIEAPLDETLPPKDPAYLGRTNHQTAQETKVKKPRQNANDAAQNNPLAQALAQKPPPQTPAQATKPREPLRLKEPKNGPKRYLPPETVQDFLPRLENYAQSAKAGDTGYQDFIAEDLPEGDVIDVNTTEFRWLGYFTVVRKSVMQAFYSPYARFGRSKEIQEKLDLYGAAKLQGKAIIKLTITRSGVLVGSELISSSGDTIVDEFWEKVLNMAAPYPPLPKDYPDETLSFTYGLEYDYGFKRQPASQTGNPLDRPRAF